MAEVFVHPKVARGQRCRQSVMTACRLHVAGQLTHRTVFLTTTYRDGVEWEPGHVKELGRRIEAWCKRRGVPFRSTWVMELTKAGKPHYHVLIFLPKALSLPKPDKRGWWPHGSTKIETARHAVGYLAKYASKGIHTAMQAPKGARITGARGLSQEQRDEKSWWMKPRWVRELLGIEDRPQKIKGGYLARSTGEILVSPWRLLERGPKWKWFEFTDDPPKPPGQPNDAQSVASKVIALSDCGFAQGLLC